MSQQDFPDDEKFSNDPEENLRMQNDFLKMKMMAESGAVFGGSGDLPPDIQNQFLKNIFEFEKTNAGAKSRSIYEILGSPDFKDESHLEDEQFKIEFDQLYDLLRNNNINVEFSRQRPDRFKFNFITKELFEHTTSFMPAKGMSTYFHYEEFHPDHELEIKDLTNLFLDDFLERRLDENIHYINNQFLEPDGNIVSLEDLIKRFQSLYEVVPNFENTSFNIEKIDFELKESEGQPSGMGFSEGIINYDLIFRDCMRKEIRGPFKIYFSREWDCWSICFFYLAGFNLQKGE
ncbi:MAG: hypothetical protein ABI267_06100 [Ginsengibacter sp.]